MVLDAETEPQVGCQSIIGPRALAHPVAGTSIISVNMRSYGRVRALGQLDFGRAKADLTALRFGTHYVSFRLA